MTNRTPNTPRPTWAGVVLAALRSKPEPATLSYLYGYVEAQAPGLVVANPRHWRDKVRQVAQRLRDKGLAQNVGKGIWVATVKLPVEPVEPAAEV